MPQSSSGNIISSTAEIVDGVVETADIKNGTILNADISASAAIDYSKLNLTSQILNADLSGSIADTKFLQITTASKVSGAAITGLASLPVGAGIIPLANLPAANTPAWVDEGSGSWAASTADKTITPTNAGKDRYKLIISFSEASGNGVGLQFNGDTGANYSSRRLTNNAVAQVTGQTEIQLQSAARGGDMEINISGKHDGNNRLYAAGNVTDGDGSATGATMANGIYTAASGADLSSIKILVHANTVTGKYHLYSLDL